MEKNPGSVAQMWKRERGMAMIFVMMSIVVIASTLAIVMVRTQGAKKETDSAIHMVTVEEAAQSGIDMAIKRLWRDYLTTTGNTTQNWGSYRYYLDSTLGIPKNEDLNFNGVKDANEEGDGRNGFEKYPPGYDKRGWSMLAAPQELKEPGTDRVIATIDSVHIARYDDQWSSYLTIRSTATVEGKSKTAVQVVDIGSRTGEHTTFAILANNINCILCHAEILSIDLETNTDKKKYGTFDRVKVAALESLMVRTSGANTNIAGTVYTRGDVYKDSGGLYTASQLASNSFKGYAFSNSNGKITQNASTGAKTSTSLVNANKNAQGDLNPMANLYLNYPTDLEKQTDGEVPGVFPAPFEDENDNRVVDDAEFEVVTNTSNGAIAFQYGPNAPAAIKAGVAYGVPSGQVYTGTALPTTSNAALNQLSSTGTYDGNLILVGTAQDPIMIEKAVSINGDLVISGPVKGEGLLNVRGNVYVTGDVTYADAPGTFGKAADGKENALAIQAGGSIIMGDYLTIRGVNHASQNTAKYPDHTKYSINMRTKNISANVEVNSKTETLKYGYFDQWSVDQNQITSGKQGQQMSFTTSELMLFNRMELDKAVKDSSYKPRFYGLRSSQPNNIYLYTNYADEHTVRYDESGVTTLAAYIASKGLPANILTKATYQYINPKNNWMSESTLRNIWYNDEMTRPSGYRDFQFDGLLYSNNAIFALTRSNGRHKSNTNGRMTIRGGIIAPDLGILIPGPGGSRGLNLLYDPRVERFLSVHDTNVVALRRQTFYYETPGQLASAN